MNVPGMLFTIVMAAIDEPAKLNPAAAATMAITRILIVNPSYKRPRQSSLGLSLCCTHPKSRRGLTYR
jgi:hypothetical protein